VRRESPLGLTAAATARATRSSATGGWAAAVGCKSFVRRRSGPRGKRALAAGSLIIISCVKLNSTRVGAILGTFTAVFGNSTRVGAGSSEGTGAGNGAGMGAGTGEGTGPGAARAAAAGAAAASSSTSCSSSSDSTASKSTTFGKYPGNMSTSVVVGGARVPTSVVVGALAAAGTSGTATATPSPRGPSAAAVGASSVCGEFLVI